MLAFACASPAAALLTYALLAAVPALSSDTGIALAVLFSGGTFLQAATMHVLPSVLAGKEGGGGGGLARQQLLAVVAGLALPLLLSAALPHDHHH